MNQSPRTIYLSASQAVALFGGAIKRDAFIQLLRKAGVPRKELNKRVFLYHEADILEFKKRKKEGGIWAGRGVQG